MSQSETPSPLAEAKVDSLETLFARDPLGLSDQDLDRIIAELRSRRALWVKAEAEGKTRAPRRLAAAKAELGAEDLLAP